MRYITLNNTILLEIGHKVKQEFGTQVMEVIGFEPEFVENLITQWVDEVGNTVTAKFMEAQLEVVE